MDSFRKAASAVALAVGLAGPFAAEAGGYYPYGAYNARHGHHHHGHHGHGGGYAAGVITGAFAGALLGVQPYYHRPAPIYVAPPPVVYREPVYVVAPPPAAYRQPIRQPTWQVICGEYNCATAYREVVINGQVCQANSNTAQCPNGQRFALD